MKNLRNLFTIAVIVMATLTSIYADTTPQTLPYTQNWSTTGTLITVNDNWSGVPGVTGYLGDDSATTVANINALSVLTATSAVDVIANAANTSTSGGVAELEADGVVALQGSGTADFPFITVYLNTTGQSKIRVQCNVKDVDPSVDDAVQQFVIQYRVGSTGNFITVPGSYRADVTTVSSATQVTPIDVTLPAAADNQPVVEVRFMTTNAAGSDEWTGIDDINITANSPNRYPTPNVDFNGDGRTDYVTLRATNSPLTDSLSASRKMLSNQQKRENGITRNGGSTTVYWYAGLNGSSSSSVLQWGLDSDFFVPSDYDGDGKTDYAVWRSGAPTVAAYYILQSSNFTFKEEKFGQSNDDPTLVGDYDGDGKADAAVFRSNPTQSFFYYRGTLNNPSGNVTFVPWGSGTDEGITGDYDGDGKNDFCVRRNVGGANQFIMLKSADFGVEFIDWGLFTDTYAPGDYDGDGKDDFAMVRGGTNLSWYILERDGGGTGANPIVWGLGIDEIVPGDYDGDGRNDVAIWRFDISPDSNFYHVRQSARITASGTEGSLSSTEWGTIADLPVQTWQNN
ncbi:MAG: VCBS repeat-containing protein [Pyrinomonadaceae bacterium]|nr:VCBS repeat-containing protein [Pyrinomonadaceae bacterium]